MRQLLRQSIKGGKCVALNQYYKFVISDEVFNIISTEIKVNGNICEILNKYFEYTNKHKKPFENEFDSQFEDHRDINQDEKAKYVNDKLSKLTIHKK